MDLLGEDTPTAVTLLREARAVIGGERARHASELARQAPLTRRSSELAAVAALFVGTGEVGADWWTVSRRAGLPSPEEYLAGARPVDQGSDLTVLETLSAWICDDVADQIWGPAVGSADLNSWQAEDRVPIPADARPGTRLVVDFDAGGRLDAVVVARADGELGSNLDFASLRYARPAEAAWSWSVAAGLGPHPLPGEDPDPYADPVDERAADALRDWAVRHGATADEVGRPWRSRGDVVAAVDRVDWVWRSAEWFAWWRCAAAMIDADEDMLTQRLHDLAR